MAMALTRSCGRARTSKPTVCRWQQRYLDEGVGRIWAEAGLKPHLTKGFKVSNDPKFEEKITDIVGFDLDPQDRAVVLCVDEKSQIQALNRTQPGLPLKKGRAACESRRQTGPRKRWDCLTVAE